MGPNRAIEISRGCGRDERILEGTLPRLLIFASFGIRRICQDDFALGEESR
jgi:hypothetical protein